MNIMFAYRDYGFLFKWYGFSKYCTSERVQDLICGDAFFIIFNCKFNNMQNDMYRGFAVCTYFVICRILLLANFEILNYLYCLFANVIAISLATKPKNAITRGHERESRHTAYAKLIIGAIQRYKYRWFIIMWMLNAFM